MHIYRMFGGDNTHVSVADVVKEFPLESEDAIKETLKTVAHHDKTQSVGQWTRKSDVLRYLQAEELHEMVRPEQEVLRRMCMHGYCRLLQAGVCKALISSNSGSWKRVMKTLVFNKSLLEQMQAMRQEMQKHQID